MDRESLFNLLAGETAPPFIVAPVDPDLVAVEGSGGHSLATIVEVLAHDYGWTIDEILSRSRWELYELMNARDERIRRENAAATGKPQPSSRRKAMIKKPGEPYRLASQPPTQKYDVGGMLAYARRKQG